jgi:hypothetical protein
MESILIFIKPFVNMNQCCIALNIIIKYQSIIISTNIISTILRTNYSSFDIEKFYKRTLAFPNMFPSEYITNYDYLKTKINKVADSFQAQLIIPNKNLINCLNCKELLSIKNKSYKKAHLYLFNEKSKECLIETKECKKCNHCYYLSYYTNKNKEKYFYENSLNHKYFSISNETILETLLLLNLNCDIMYKHASFKNFCSSHNSLFNLSNNNSRSKKLIKIIVKYL